ncbi:LysM peptidoglycan-binding domain-containing protein [Actinoplanes sp. NPDC049265]|uniref:LysM peptidoglycan-binding domain-containing protein n=1 Tax=Actinoplanes sp. NPDC049265 TaxID=3363902 RepID=UPI00371FC7A3
MTVSHLRRAVLLVAALLVAATVLPAPARAETKWYEVRAEYQGEQEFLYEIAERFLGDGDRYTEIFDLNKGRVQADGMVLDDPEQIEAGWILILPPDAAGDGVRTGPLPAPSSAAPPSTAPATTPRADKSGGTPMLLPILLVVAVLVVAGAVIVILRRRRQKPPVPPSFDHPTSTTRTLHAAADWIIDRALRGLAGAPAILGVSLDEERMVLRLAGPATTPAGPWTPAADGRTWTASLRDLQAQPGTGDVPSPCPRLVTLGTAGATRELVDLGRSPGLISVGGDETAARELVTGWAEELISSPWSDRVRVITGDVWVRVRGEQLTVLSGVGPALDAADAAHGVPGVLILGTEPEGRDLGRANHLATRPDEPWVVIVPGGSGRGGWNFTAHPDGRLDTGVLGLTVARQAS